MLPSRAYADLSVSAYTIAPQPQPDTRAVILVVADAAVANQFPSSAFTLVSAPRTADALRGIDRLHPRVVAIDWEAPDVDAPRVCAAAGRLHQAHVLVTTASPGHVPAALKAGCHAVLLKPLTRNLVATRVGRLCRESSALLTRRRGVASVQQRGTNRVWPNTVCERCNTPGATSFEFASHRRMWYACLSCDSVWLGPHQE
jgi:DNA-binding response OmpR family regulator